MTDLRTAAQQALEAMENTGDLWWNSKDAAITALKSALAEPEQEPVACSNTFACRCPKHYTAPPQRKQLSYEEIDRLWREPMSADWEHREYARAVEAAHGIKENT
jgi:hypothetical protein